MPRPTARIDQADLALLRRAVDRLHELAPSLKAELRPCQGPGEGTGLPFPPDAELLLGGPWRKTPVRFLVEVKRTHLSYALAEGVMARYRGARVPWLLCAPYVAPKMARYLVERGVGFLDPTGNCHIATQGEVLLHHVESRRVETTGPAPAAVRAPGYNVIFAILAKPELLEATVREIERYAQATKSTVSNQLRRLEAEGVVARSQGHLRLVRPRELLEKFVAGYSDVLRPRLYVGRYATPFRGPEALETQIEQTLPATTGGSPRHWWWGGASAGWRLSRHYHAPTTTLHVDELPTDTFTRLRALPSRTGALEILRVPNEAAVAAGQRPPEIVHPILVYAEMMASPDERTREAAAGLRQQHLRAFA